MVEKEILEKLKLLCKQLENDSFESLEGIAYVNALYNAFPLKNKNDFPFLERDMLLQPQFKDFKFPGMSEFIPTCILEAKPMTIKNNEKYNEKIIVKNFLTKEGENIFYKKSGILYLITCLINNKEYIIKFGQSRTNFKLRLQSYNCGSVSILEQQAQQILKFYNLLWPIEDNLNYI